MSRRLAFGQEGDDVHDLFQDEVLGHVGIHCFRDPDGDICPAFFLSINGARDMRVRGVQMSVENCDELGEVGLSYDCLTLSHQFFKERFFLPYAMEVEERFGACVSESKPFCRQEVAVACYNFLEYIHEPTLGFKKNTFYLFVCRVLLKLCFHLLDLLCMGFDVGLP
jgi:hypothetical protein